MGTGGEKYTHFSFVPFKAFVSIGEGKKALRRKKGKRGRKRVKEDHPWFLRLSWLEISNTQEGREKKEKIKSKKTSTPPLFSIIPC